MRELELLGHIAESSKGLAASHPRVLAGPGDDCAVVDAGGARALLLKTDQVVEGFHFRPGAPPDLIARKALARPLSDVAAMAGEPIAALVAATLPEGYPHGGALALFDAVRRWGGEFSCPVVGGDISRGAGLALCVSVAGLAHASRGAVRRCGARPGDGVYVTGTVGGSFDRSSGLGKHMTFEPRLREAEWLAGTLGPALSAMIDVSDGLGLDAWRIGERSAVALVIDAARVPLTNPGADVLAAMGEGEDYELLFTVRPGFEPPPTCPATGCPITGLGVVEAGAGGAWVVHHGRRLDAQGLGYRHGG